MSPMTVQRDVDKLILTSHRRDGGRCRYQTMLRLDYGARVGDAALRLVEERSKDLFNLLRIPSRRSNTDNREPTRSQM